MLRGRLGGIVAVVGTEPGRVTMAGPGAGEAVVERMDASPLLLERIRYAVELPNGKWAAIVAILVLQAYLILAPNGSSP
jgi:hypothetical protein